ncbi:MAG: hypothetical protein A4E28_01166 [Methanocella sp. PtaU1.Bin125]|nr:MAG: hypothetical protein A4E28_01166 [Methanocella sp. PtaU1.Bin125]
MPDTLIPMDRLRDVEVDTAAEVRKIVASRGLDRAPEGSLPLSQVYRVYRDLKTLGFFSLVMGRFGNRECGSRVTSLRTYDIYDVSTGGGRIFFVVEASVEAVDAFLDDGSILLKIREWLADAYRRVCTAGETEDPVKLWDDAFHARGSPLPPEVRVIPFYNKNLAPGVPGVILALVKGQRSASRDQGRPTRIV